MNNKKYLKKASLPFFLLCIVFLGYSLKREMPSQIEQSIIQRALQDPATAAEYFMSEIERNPPPTVDIQAMYIYGIGLTHETQGDFPEAINYYLSASAFKNTPARHALERLNIEH